jgi:quinol monooxygenase YgiN
MMRIADVWTMGFALGFAALGAVIAATWMNSHAPLHAQEAASAGPLRHVVLFKFKPEATQEQLQQIVEAFRGLPKKIDGITAFEWGTDVSPEGKSAGFTHCFVVTFKDAQARDAYLPHPAHQEFVAILRPRLENVLVVDYFAQP